MNISIAAVAPNTEDAVVIPDGYRQEVVIRWGDPILPGAPEFDFANQTPEAQAARLAAIAGSCKPALIYDLKCAGSQAYLRLAREVVKRERQRLKLAA